MSLKIFREMRKEGPIRVAWFDDKPKNVKEMFDELVERGFEARLFDEPEELFQEIDQNFDQQGPRKIPDVLITDLLIEARKKMKTPKYTGEDVGNTIMGKYLINIKVPARIGIASYWPELIKKAPRQVFGFEYLASTLTPTKGKTFDKFVKAIKHYALSLWVDCWCMNYMERNPIKEYNDKDRYAPGEPPQQFGYITRYEKEYSVVWLWNPQKLHSGKAFLNDTKFLESHGIKEEQQPFRVVNFIDLRQPNAAIRVVEQLSGTKEFQFVKIL